MGLPRISEAQIKYLKGAKMTSLRKIELTSLRISSTLAILATMPALLSLIGIVGSWPILQTYSSDFPAMTIETVVGVIFAAMPIFILNRMEVMGRGDNREGRGGVLLLTLGVMGLYIATLIFYLGHSIEVVFQGQEVPEALSSIRTCISLLFIVGTTFLVTYSPRFIQFGMCALLLPFFIAIISVTGYVLKASTYYVEFSGLGMSIPTCFSVFALVFAVLTGPVRNGSGNFLFAPGSAGLVARYLLPVTLLFPPIGTWLILFGRRWGFYTENFALVLLVVLPCLLLSIVIAQISARLAKSEKNLRHEKIERAIAEKMNKAKDDFLVTLSHELRTPMTAVLGFLEVLPALTPHSPEYQQAFGIVAKQAQLQNELIAAILDLSAVALGKFEMIRREFDVKKALEKVFEEVKLGALEKGLSFKWTFSSEAYLYQGDEKRIQQMVRALASNAVKFTPDHGVVEVIIEMNEKGLELRVQDNGVGLDQASQTKVFDRFWQEDGSIRRNHGGLGIGLSLAREIVRAHGGVIKVASEGKNQGSVFTVCLPAMS